MSQHLSEQRITEWMVDGPSPEEERHVLECAECEAQVAKLRDSLGMFRGAVREMAAQQLAVPRLEKAGEKQRVLRLPRRNAGWRWAVAAAAVLMLVGLPVYRVEEQRQHSAEVARQDAELLDEVNADLSSGVAAPMKPLERMVSWGREGKPGEPRKF